MLPETPRGRLEWAVRESLVVLGLLAFWVLVGVAVTLLAGLLALPYQLLGGWVFRPLVVVSRNVVGFWSVVVPLTVVTASLYVLVRAGVLLLDHHHDRRDA